jgi:hypothetical protein
MTTYTCLKIGRDTENIYPNYRGTRSYRTATIEVLLLKGTIPLEGFLIKSLSTDI